MSSEPEVKTHEDVLAWIHWWRGRMPILWKGQDATNRQFREDLRLYEDRLQCLETKAVRWSAIAALLGAILGAVSVQLFRWYLFRHGAGL